MSTDFGNFLEEIHLDQYKPVEMPKDDSSNEIEKSFAEAKAHLAQIVEITNRVQQLAAESEAARKRADSEALYAANAKSASEAQSTAIANLKGGAEADVQYLGANKQKSEEILAALTVAKANADSESKAIADFKRESERLAAELLTWAKKGQDNAELSATAQQEFAELREKINGYYAETTRAQKVATQLSQQAADAVAKIDTAVTDTTAKHANITALSAEATELRDNITAQDEEVKDIVAKLVKSNKTATDYEKRLADILEKSQKLTEQTEALLPGATSAGLASAFADQRSRAAKPQSRWLTTFVACILLLIVISIPSFVGALTIKSAFTWDDVLRGLIIRLPLAIPLIWLAIYAGRNYMLSIRLEEDYAYKETVSRAFEGYRREMEKIVHGDADGISPVATLCANILAALAERPGRIYDGKHQDITPMAEAQAAAERAISARNISL